MNIRDFVTLLMVKAWAYCCKARHFYEVDIPVTVHNDEDRSEDAANEAAARRGLGAGFGLWFEGGKGASAP